MNREVAAIEMEVTRQVSEFPNEREVISRRCNKPYHKEDDTQDEKKFVHLPHKNGDFIACEVTLEVIQFKIIQPVIPSRMKEKRAPGGALYNVGSGF